VNNFCRDIAFHLQSMSKNVLLEVKGSVVLCLAKEFIIERQQQFCDLIVIKTMQRNKKFKINN